MDLLLGFVALILFPISAAMLRQQKLEQTGSGKLSASSSGLVMAVGAFVIGLFAVSMNLGQDGTIIPVLIVAAVTVWVFFRLAQGSQEKESVDDELSGGIRVTMRTSTAQPPRKHRTTLRVDENGLVTLTPYGRFPVTIQGVTKEQIQPIVDALENREYPPGIKMRLGALLARTNARSQEVDSFLAQVRRKFAPALKELMEEHGDQTDMSPADRADLRQEIIEEAVDSLDICTFWEDLEILLTQKPISETADDALLNIFGDRYDLLETYLRVSRKRSNTIKAESKEDRKAMRELCDLGLARDGHDLPPEELLETLRMKDIQEMVNDVAPKKFGRKAHAIEFASNLEDIMERIGKTLPLRSTFRLEERKDLEAARAAIRYNTEYAGLIVTTYITESQAGDMFDRDSSDFDLATEKHEDCDFCDQYDGKSPKSKTSKAAPPHHVGCTCRLTLNFDDD